MMSHKVKLLKILKKFDRILFQNVDAQFCSGQSYAITGSSGSGKSTLLRIIAGFIEPTEGIINYQDIEYHTFSYEQRLYLQASLFGFVFQDACLLPELTVLENVELASMIAVIVSKEITKNALYTLDKVGLIDYIHYYPHQLSGGQQQRVALARALAKNPKFLIADEPTGNLDPSTSKEIIDLLIKNCHQQNVALIVSTHDEKLINCVDTVYTIQAQHIVKRKQHV